MSLDQNLFTLNVVPSSEDPDVVDLIDPSGVVHYRKQKLTGSTYTMHVLDPVANSLLITATAPSATSKHKTLQLHNPEVVVELKYTGTLSFKWGFRWEEHEFEWRREECYILRKPDPAVLVAVTKEPAGRLKTSSVQILDYNLNRFDIDDRKGLEILILTALLTFHDANEASHTPRADEASASASPQPVSGSSLTGLLSLGIGSRRPSALDLKATQSRTPSNHGVTDSRDLAAPAVPPRPPPRTGIDRISELHMLRTLQGEGEANEVEVSNEGSAEDYAQFALDLLKDDAMLFISIRSASQGDVPKVLRVVEETKRLRHKAGIADAEELHQYVSYETAPEAKGPKAPRRINLDDPESKGPAAIYTPPSSVMVHLSKIDMPELKPRAQVKDPGPELGWVKGGHAGAINSTSAATSGAIETKYTREVKKKVKDKEKEKPSTSSDSRQGAGRHEKEQKRAEKEQKKAEKDQNKRRSLSPRPEVNKSTKPPVSGSVYHVPPHRSHPYQPSSSPSQLNNPGIYSAPPPFPPSRPAPPQAASAAPPYPHLGWAGPVGARDANVPPSSTAQSHSNAASGAFGSAWPWTRR